jgi:hypothetical protein
MTPLPSRLGTATAKGPETIEWADGRASLGVIPEIVMQEWGIDLIHDKPLWHGGFRTCSVGLESMRTSSSTSSAEAPLHGHHSLLNCNSLRIFVRASPREEPDTSTLPSVELE